MLTGGGYQDYKLKREQKRAGFKPYSFKFGDTYISYQRLDPFGMFFGLVADYNEMYDEMSEKDRALFANAVPAKPMPAIRKPPPPSAPRPEPRAAAPRSPPDFL